MYAIQSLTRIYAFILLCVCSALFSVPSLAAIEGYWDASRGTFITSEEVQRSNQRNFGNIKRPANSTVNVSSNPWNVNKNASGGLSTSSQATIRTMNHPSIFTGTFNHSLISAQNALKSCVRSPVCAGRALGSGLIIYEGIQAWQEVYGFVVDDDGQVFESRIIDLTDTYPSDSDYLLYGRNGSNIPIIYPTVTQACQAVAAYYGQTLKSINGIMCNTVKSSGSPDQWLLSKNSNIECAPDTVKVSGNCVSNKRQLNPVSQSELDQSIDASYSPEPSDAPFVLGSSQPDSIFLSTPSSVDLPSTTSSSTNSLGETLTNVTNKTVNYEVANNNSPNPSINSNIVENATVYNDYGTVISNSTTTTSSEGVQGEVTEPAPIELELPEFCTWAEFICDWLNWTKDQLDEEEPDLSVLISEFEPDEGVYSSGIGSGSCPAPMSLNLGIISQTVEVSYQPFCDFLAMIRPLVIAGAWLISAFMYVGVLRRG